ncbi:MBL fold metallo-hydrolase [Amycolatopsis cihanbeyliensis]|uniref:Ribonuclease BN (tRNA processing enzyme) n=1 Tax=Amycolatopsis cihanbeyliensis TaxID=1128664 RepID=A0A542DJ72_AMYCI|nr:MBL fold metallo-hydrolase [Amycolatopsis cihanbeyliensis]TQJ03054.1 ribonuclease BN (tRNA processing enzyme) [Amycolatopsis cihanbeyliensis]
MTELTVLGSCGAWPEPGRACSGFLLHHDGFRVVLDLGYGTAARLLAHCRDGAVDAAVITHEHPDHCADLSALGRVRHYTGAARLPLYCPPGVLGVLAAAEPRPDPHSVFEVHEFGATARLGPFRLTAFPLPHHVPNWGVRLDAPGVSLAYTGDSGPAAALADLAAGVDLFIAEATLQGPAPRTGPRHLLTAREAGEVAAGAGARSLLLTHFWPGSDRAVSVREARAGFDGPVLAAEEDLVVTL